MTDTNTPASVLAEQIVDAVTDAANLVTCDGYYEIDKEAATNAIIPFLTRNQTDRKAVAEDAAAPIEWPRGTRVTKIKGSSWTGKVVGFYSTNLTPVGYAVESETEIGSVQIYPRAALRLASGEGV